MTWFEDYVEGCNQEDIDSAAFDCSAFARAILDRIKSKRLRKKLAKLFEEMGVKDVASYFNND